MFRRRAWWIVAVAGVGCSGPADVSFDGNAQPFAHPGTGSDYLVGTRVTLDGTASWDPDGDALSYQWSLVSCPDECAGSLENADSAVAQLELRAVGDYAAQLTVTDSSGRENAGVVHVRSDPAQIDLDAGADRTVEWQIPVELSASVSVEAGRPATVTWKLVEKPQGSGATIAETGVSTASFVPDVAGRYTAVATAETAHNTQSEDVVILAYAQRMLLDFRPLGMEYSRSLERIVAISANPPSLHVIDPVAGTETSVSLPAVSRYLSLEPGGARAAIGHENGVTIVGLDPPAVVDTFAVPTIIPADVDCVFGAGNLVHCFSQSGHVEPIRTVDLSSGAVTEGDKVSPKAVARLHPSTSAIYSTSTGSGPQRYDVSKVPVTFVRGVAEPRCGGVWFNEEGTALINRCGDVLRSSDDPALDMTLLADLTPQFGLRWVSDSIVAGRIATIGSSSASVSYFDRETFSPLGTTPVPDTLFQGQFFASEARFVAYRSDGSELYAIADASFDLQYLTSALFVLAP